MKLIRSGVFETNSSSAHSLAYGTSKVVRGAGYGLPPNETDFSNPLYHLTEVPEYYKGETLIAQLDDFGWGYEQLGGFSRTYDNAYFKLGHYEMQADGRLILHDTFYQIEDIPC